MELDKVIVVWFRPTDIYGANYEPGIGDCTREVKMWSQTEWGLPSEEMHMLTSEGEHASILTSRAKVPGGSFRRIKETALFLYFLPTSLYCGTYSRGRGVSGP